MTTFPGVDPQLLAEVKQALAITVEVNGWPSTYGRRQPEVQIRTGDNAFTRFSSAGPDPFRLNPGDPVLVVIEHRFLETSFVAQRLLSQGFTREQVLVQVLSHEAYHSNEGQHLEQCRVPLQLFQSLFTASVRPELSSQSLAALLNAASLSKPFEQAFSATRDVQVVEPLAHLTRLSGKANEGAADVYSLVVFNRAYPQDGVRFSQVLSQARRSEREMVDGDPQASDIAMINTYDNASCLDALCSLPLSEWPDDQKSCTFFALCQAVNDFRQEPLLETLWDAFDHLDQNLLELTRAPGIPNVDAVRAKSGDGIETTPRIMRWFGRRR